MILLMFKILLTKLLKINFQLLNLFVFANVLAKLEASCSGMSILPQFKEIPLKIIARN